MPAIPGAVVFADDGRIGDGLSNAGDRVLVLAPNGEDTLSEASFGTSDGLGSWVFLEPGQPARSHANLPLRGPHSAGLASPTLLSLFLEVVIAEDSTRTLRATVVGTFSDGSLQEVTRQTDIDPSPDDPAVLGAGEITFVARWEAYEATATVRIEDREDVESPSNHLPVVVSDGEVVVVVGHPFRHTIVIEDLDRDPLTTRIVSAPAWVRLEGNDLTGTPPIEAFWPILIQLDDSHDRVDWSIEVRAVDPVKSLETVKPASVGLTWIHPLAIPDGFEVQIDRGPDYDSDRQEIVWVPEESDLGSSEIVALVRGPSTDLFLMRFRVEVRSRPEVRVVEILADPRTDTNGDGHIDPEQDEYITILNDGDRPLDLSGWWLGDDDGKPAVLPRGTVVAQGERLRLVGESGTLASDAVGAQGRIGNGLAGRDRLLLIHPDGPDTVLSVVYDNGNVGEALVFSTTSNAWVPRSETETIETSEDARDFEWTRRPHPNPFRSCVRIPIQTTGPGYLSILNVLGQPVLRASVRGREIFEWCGHASDGTPMARGVYLLQLSNAEDHRATKVLYLK